MPEHIQYEDNDLFNPETHHEHSDVPVRPLFWFIAIFIISGVVSHVGLYLLYKAFVAGERNRMDPPQTQVARPADAGIPKNQPLLQPFEKGDAPPFRQIEGVVLAETRAAEDKVLKNYGWVDKQQGTVHIPIEDAKKLYAARAAVVAPAPSPAAPPASQPAPPSSSTGGAQ